MDKQCFLTVAPAANLRWKHNGLRHAFISFRLAEVKDVGQVALEAGNSAQMVFRHYPKLVTATQAKAWFSIRPVNQPGGIIPMPAGPPSAATPSPAEPVATTLPT
jgi:hypothetical protein